MIIQVKNIPPPHLREATSFCLFYIVVNIVFSRERILPEGKGNNLSLTRKEEEEVKIRQLKTFLINLNIKKLCVKTVSLILFLKILSILIEEEIMVCLKRWKPFPTSSPQKFIFPQTLTSECSCNYHKCTTETAFDQLVAITNCIYRERSKCK